MLGRRRRGAALQDPPASQPEEPAGNPAEVAKRSWPDLLKARRRPWTKRLRHRRRDWVWRGHFYWGKACGRPSGHARAWSRHPEVAVAVVAVGPTYWDWAKTMLASLRGKGGFDGPVYIATDNPRAFAQEGNCVVVPVPATRHRLVAKSCKLLLMRWVEQPVMLYLDADLVVTASVEAWYLRVRGGLGTLPLWAYPDSNPFPGAWHSGLLLVDRRRAAPLYRRWLAAVRSGRYRFDQECLAEVACGTAIGRFPAGDFEFLGEIRDLEATPPCFVHITRGLIRKYPEAALRRYLQKTLGVERLPHSFGRSIQ